MPSSRGHVFLPAPDEPFTGLYGDVQSYSKLGTPLHRLRRWLDRRVTTRNCRRVRRAMEQFSPGDQAAIASQLVMESARSGMYAEAAKNNIIHALNQPWPWKGTE